jgi:aminopeptidase N
MENKGLNVFNSKYVLARPETATDAEYEAIEGVIGHEYFHNWTGNRVTCRDWFQLTLKEGLTVFRDQLFTADMTSPAVKRIDDVKRLRLAQFAEDAGPMSHPIRPESYISMDNFYTATVYEKGAETIRMYETLLTSAGFRAGMDLYFERHDGRAVTCDDFRAAMADANDKDLDLFERWYLQSGTPRLEMEGEYDARAKSYMLTLRQLPPERPGAAPSAEIGASPWQPLHIPVRVGLLGGDGRDLPLRLVGEEDLEPAATSRVLELVEEERRFTFVGIEEPPVPSVLRDFSAPVKLTTPRTRDELAFLMAYDSDAFNRWDAGQELAKQELLGLADASRDGRSLRLDPLFSEAFAKILADPDLDGSLKSQALTLPDEKILGLECQVIDVDALHEAREFMRRELAGAHRAALESVYRASAAGRGYSTDRSSIGRRRLRNVALAYLASLGEAETTALASAHFENADNMTDSQAALSLLVSIEGPERDAALALFYERWCRDPLVLDKWFSVQALSKLPDTAARVVELSRHPDYSLENPNRARSLVAVFAGANLVRFHGADGAGYRFLTDVVLELDDRNPQLAARLLSNLNSWRRFDIRRQELMGAELERVGAKKSLSKDVFEIVTRALASPPRQEAQ